MERCNVGKLLRCQLDLPLSGIESDHGRINAVARPEAGLAPGVISISHSWGDLPEYEYQEGGTCTNRLVADDTHFEPLVGMCRQSAIPVNIRRAEVSRSA